MTRPAVTIRDVSKSWMPEGRAPAQALADPDFAVVPGEFMVLLGPSGCGRSALLSTLSGEIAA